MPYPVALALLAQAARSSSGAGASADLAPVTTPATPPRTTAALTLRVDALTGTSPTLAVSVETSDDQTNWTALGAFTTRSTTGSESKRFPGALRYLRASWVLGGTGGPSTTFGVSGEALLVLATPADLARYGVNAKALASVALADQDAVLDAVSGDVLTKLGGRYGLPPSAWPLSVRKAVCQIAAPEVMIPRGLGPEDAKVLMGQAKLAWERISEIASEKADPQGMLVDATPGVYDAGAFVSSKPRRGW